MKRERVLYWAPRILAIVYIAFLGLFALDVFTMEGTVLQKIGGFFIHLLPNFLLLLGLFIAWKNEWLGSLLFIALFAVAVVFFNGDILLFAPLLFVSMLFFLHRHLPERNRRQGISV